MAGEIELDSQLEIAQVWYTDIVGYSKLPIDQQSELLRQLNQIVRGTEQFRAAEAAGKLVRLSTGDGMALAFFTSPDAPVRCAIEIARALQNQPKLQLRMGVDSGPVDRVADVNDRSNVAGTGINMAQRVMDCGDAGHILLSKRVAGDLAQYTKWQPQLHDLGEVEVKHGVEAEVVNFYDDGLGNPAVPEKIGRLRRMEAAAARRGTIAWSLGAIALVVALATAFWIQSRHAGPAHFPASNILEKSIAVLPFENLSEEKENAYFADEVQNEILTDLAKVADLKVISHTSVMVYKAGNPRNLREIGQQLGVAHVLEGSVQRAGSKVRVNAQLIDARNDKHLWAKTYDRELADVFAIETELAQTIAGELQAKLTSSEKAAIEEKPTQDLVAYEFYARAVSLIYNVQVPPVDAPEKSLSEAVDLLNKAVARDPNFLLAYCQLAFAHDMVHADEIDHTPARLALAQSAIDSAFRLRPDSGEAHLALGWHLQYSEYDRARAEIALAQQSLPNDPRVYELAGKIDRRQGRWADATHNLQRASELDPRNLPYLLNLAATYNLWLHDYEQYAKSWIVSSPFIQTLSQRGFGALSSK